MKNLRFLYSFLILFSLLFSISAKDSKVYYIFDTFMNYTGYSVNLENIKEDYLYFSYDFLFHIKAVPGKRDAAYFEFKVNSDILGKKPLSFGFVENNYDDIRNVSQIKNINWEELNFVHKNEYKYYYEIKRSNYKMITVLLRIPLKGKKSGEISAENILEIPNFIKEEPKQEPESDSDSVSVSGSLSDSVTESDPEKIKGNILKFGILLILIRILILWGVKLFLIGKSFFTVLGQSCPGKKSRSYLG